MPPALEGRQTNCATKILGPVGRVGGRHRMAEGTEKANIPPHQPRTFDEGAWPGCRNSLQLPRIPGVVT